MSLLEKNLNILYKKNPTLAEKIASIKEITADFSLEESLSGDVNIKRNGIFLHDNIDPEQEAIDQLGKIKENTSCSFNFIYKLGLGYLLKRFNKKLKGFIIVYEPDIELLRLVFEIIDFTKELSNPNVFIFDSLDDLDGMYTKYFFFNFSITTSIIQIYRETDFHNAEKFINHLGYLHGVYQSNYKVFWSKTHSWTSSLINNLDVLSKYDEVNSLKNVFEGKPALIVSAGPSLDKNIDLIKKYQNNFVIFCVGTALKSLVKHNIKPDFVCFIEYLKITNKMVEGLNLNDTNIILQPITCREIFDTSCKNKFIFYPDNDESAKWIANLLGINRKEYINRGTVSINALISAKLLGCKTIILVGQDLAYTNNKCYASGSIYEDYNVKDDKVIVNNINNFAKKLDVNKDVVEKRLSGLSKKLYKVKGQNGETLFTAGDLASFIDYFKDIANAYSNEIKFINATQGGAQIDGYENMSLENAVSKYANSPLNKDFSVKQLNSNLNNQKIFNEINNMMTLYDANYKPIFDLANFIITQINDYDPKNPENYLKYNTQILELLACYNKLTQQPQNNLFNLLIARNKFMIEHYITKTDDETYLNRLLSHLICLFDTDYRKFIIPKIELLKEVISKQEFNNAI